MKAEIVIVVAQQILFAHQVGGEICIAIYDPMLHYGKIKTLGRVKFPNQLG